MFDNCILRQAFPHILFVQLLNKIIIIDLGMLRKSINFGIKNFYKQMGLSQHFTIGGLLRRTQRQYPRIYIFTKFSIIFTMVGTTSLLLISGSSLPFQGAVKSWIGHRAEQICNFWYIQTGVADILTYVMVTYQIIFYSFKNNVQQCIPSYLAKINESLEENYLKDGKAKTNVKIQNIINAVELLKLLITQFQISRDPNCLLASQQLVKQYGRIVDNSICKIEGKLKEQQMKQFVVSLKIFQYLIKYGKQSIKKQSLVKLTTLLQDSNKAFFATYIMRNQQFKNELKRILKQTPHLKPTVLQLLQAIEAVKSRAST